MGRSFHLTQLAGQYAVCRIAAGSPVPAWAAEALATGGFCSVTRTAEELSVVCEASHAPEGVQAARDWACFQLRGPFDFGETGVLAALLAPLAAAGIGIFAVSTYDTDYILVNQENAWATAEVWRAAGHSVVAAG